MKLSYEQRCHPEFSTQGLKSRVLQESAKITSHFELGMRDLGVNKNFAL